MENYLHRIALIREQISQKKGVSSKERIHQQLKPLIARATVDSRFDIVWTLFEPYAAALGLENTIAWLRSMLLESGQMPHLFRALFNLELASRLGESGIRQECFDCLSRVEAALSLCDHHFAALEVQRLKIHYGFEVSEKVLSSLYKIFLKYSELGYVSRASLSASFPLQRAFAAGDLKTYNKLLRILHNMFKSVGMVYEGVLLNLQQLSTMNALTGRAGKVAELGYPLLEQSLQKGYWTVAFHVAQVLSLAENQMDNWSQARYLADKALSLCQDHDLLAESTAAYNYVLIHSAQPKTEVLNQMTRHEELAGFLAPYIEQDIQAGETKMACEKLMLLASIVVGLGRASPDHSESNFREAAKLWDRIEELTAYLHGKDRIMTQGNCEEARVTQLLYEGKRRQDDTKEDEAISKLDILSVKYKENELFVQEAIKHQMKGMCFIQKWQKYRGKDLSTKRDLLIKAATCLESACQIFQDISVAQFLLTSGAALCQIYVTVWDLGLLPLDACLSRLAWLERIADTIRQELSAMKGLQALLSKQRFAGSKLLIDLYNWAIGMCVTAQDWKGVFLWSQKRKARSLSDILGLGVIMPAASIASLRQNPDAAQALDIWFKAQTQLYSFPDNEKGFIRQDIETAEAFLKGFQPFREYVAIRDGVINGIDQARRLHEPFGSSSTCRNTHMVEWITYSNELFMLVTECGANSIQPRFFRLAITLSKVRDWCAQHFRDYSSRKRCLLDDSIHDSDAPLRMLDPLIAPLALSTHENDLLIFSPTSYLSSIPLHALRVHTPGEQPCALLSRHPVVYTPSITVLESCINRVMTATAEGPATFLSSFDHPSESDKIAQQMAALEGVLKGRSASGGLVTKSAFGHIVHGSMLIHFHGHCQLAADNILGQCLVLTPEAVPVTSEHNLEPESTNESRDLPPLVAGSIETKPISIPGMGSESADLPTLNPAGFSRSASEPDLLLFSAEENADKQNHLTLEEIFRLPLGPALVVLIACSSTFQQISAGDEPLGLIPGLLCAGAASVVGASWPIPSGVGRYFSDKFYAAFQIARENPSVGPLTGYTSSPKYRIIDLAVVLQDAVKKMMDDEETNMSATYYWAAFSLWGSWGFRSDLLSNYKDTLERKN